MARLLGLDPGTVRCGVAITDSARTLAFPRPALGRDEGLVAALRAIVDEEGVDEIVVGRPLSLAGRPTASTDSADALFAEVSAAFSDLRVVQFDERLTTVEAQRSLTQAGRRTRDQRTAVDGAAAVVLVRAYLEGSRDD